MASSLARQIAHTLGMRLVTFVCRAGLIVVLAKLLTPEDYGVYALIATVGVFGVVLAGLNLHAYVFRASPGLSEDEQLSIFKTTFLFELALSSVLVTALLVSGFLPAILPVLKAEAYVLEFAVGLVLLILLVAMTEVLQFLSAQTRIEESNWVDFLSQAAWVPVVVAAWLLGWKLGVLGLLIAQGAGCLAALTYGARQIGLRHWLAVSPRWSLLRTAIVFSIPMALPTLSLYSLKLADRFILSHLGSLEEVGVYSFAYMIINTVYTFTAWIIFTTCGPRIIAAHNAGDLDRRDWLQTYMLKIAVVCFAAALASVLVAAPWLVTVVARPEFLPAVQALPLVSLAYIFIILAYPAHYLLLLGNRVKLLVAIDLFGVAASLVLNWLLIPSWSFIGAAIASAVGFGIVLLGKYAASGVMGRLQPGILFSVQLERRALQRAVAYLRGTAV